MRHERAAGNACLGLDQRESAYTDIVGSIADPDLVREAMQGVSRVIHAATLHKPHAVTHSKQDFLTTNIQGTLCLLEAATAANVGAFVFTSTTSVYGDALRPGPGEPAAWITETTVPLVKNIYGATKLAAEDLCRLFHRNHGLNTVVLRTSRFFPEDDDDSAKQAEYGGANLKANEFLYRRADLEDVVSAHLLAADRAEQIGHDTFVISATTPFTTDDLHQLGSDPAAVVARIYPDFSTIYAAHGWQMLPRLDRVYVNTAAREKLGWQPRWDFSRVLTALAAGTDLSSELARAVGKKPYHPQTFTDGPYPVE